MHKPEELLVFRVVPAKSIVNNQVHESFASLVGNIEIGSRHAVADHVHDV